MMSARANRVCGECRSAQIATLSKSSRGSNLMRLASCIHQAVALAAHRAQVARKAGVGLDLATQPRHLHVDRPLVDAAADRLAQRLATQHLAELAAERTQQ